MYSIQQLEKMHKDIWGYVRSHIGEQVIPRLKAQAASKHGYDLPENCVGCYIAERIAEKTLHKMFVGFVRSAILYATQQVTNRCITLCCG